MAQGHLFIILGQYGTSPIGRSAFLPFKILWGYRMKSALKKAVFFIYKYPLTLLIIKCSGQLFQIPFIIFGKTDTLATFAVHSNEINQ